MYLSATPNYSIEIMSKFYINKKIRLHLLKLEEMIIKHNEKSIKEQNKKLVLSLLEIIKIKYNTPTKPCYHTHLKTEGNIRMLNCDVCKQYIYHDQLYN